MNYNAVMTNLRILAFALSILVLTACDQAKKIDEMKDNTAEMNRTTKTLLDKTGEMKDGLDKMSKTSDEMNASTKDLRSLTREELVERLEAMNGTTGALFEAMRQGDTSALRRASLNELLRETTLQARVAEAGLYLMSFEYQVLGTIARDLDPRHREVLYQQALLEFFLKLDKFAPPGGDIQPDAKPTDDPTDEENRASAYNALAFSLHKTNRQQVEDPIYGRPVSMYDLIITALRMKPEIEAGRFVLPNGPHYIKEVLARPAMVEQLLQTRYNMFAYGFLGLTTNMVELGSIRQALKLLFKLDIDMSVQTRGPATLAYIGEEILQPAAQTAEDMLDVGITPKFTRLTSLAVSRLKIQFDSKNVQTLSKAGAAREEELAELWKRYSKPKAAAERGGR